MVTAKDGGAVSDRAAPGLSLRKLAVGGSVGGSLQLSAVDRSLPCPARGCIKNEVGFRCFLAEILSHVTEPHTEISFTQLTN